MKAGQNNKYDITTTCPGLVVFLIFWSFSPHDYFFWSSLNYKTYFLNFHVLNSDLELLKSDYITNWMSTFD